jgi:malate permease and related proteins
MITTTLSIMVPLLAMVTAGAILGRRGTVDEKTLVVIVADVFMPLLIVEAMRKSTLSAREFGSIIAAVAIVTALLLVVAFGFARITRSRPAEVVMPIVFMNTGFLGVPLLILWGGVWAGSVAIIFDQMLGIFMVLTGLIVCTGSVSPRSVMRALGSPLLLATVVGLVLRGAPVELPSVVTATLAFASPVAPPVAAFAVGVTLGRQRPEWSARIVAALAVRFGAGAGIGAAAAWVLRLPPETSAAVIILASLPSAVFSYVLPARYGVDARFARSMVALSTVIAVVLVPLIIALLEP